MDQFEQAERNGFNPHDTTGAIHPYAHLHPNAAKLAACVEVGIKVKQKYGLPNAYAEAQSYFEWAYGTLAHYRADAASDLFNWWYSHPANENRIF